MQIGEAADTLTRKDRYTSIESHRDRMVGFGSSLRMARRPGWEEAYLDYEALKLLLTQIEAVYEEEAHLQQQRQQLHGGGHQHQGTLDDLRDLDVMFVETPDRRGPRRRDSQQQQPRGSATGEGGDTNNKARDYRDDLFLESDSDAAFESLMKYDKYSAEEAASDLEQQQQQMDFEQQVATMQSLQQSPRATSSVFSERDPHARMSHHQHQQQQQQQHRSDMASTGTAATGLSFSFASSYYNQDHNAVSEFGGAFASTDNYDNFDEQEDTDSQDEADNKCVPSFGRLKKATKKKPPKSNNGTKKNLRPHHSHYRSGTGGRGSSFLSPTKESDKFYMTAGGGGSNKADAFILDNNDDDASNDDDDNNNNQNTLNYTTELDMDGMSTLTSFSQTQTHRQPSDANTSILQQPFRRTGTSEMAPLLMAPQGSGSPLYSFASPTGPGTPPPVDAFYAPNAGGDNYRPAALFMPNIANAKPPTTTTTTHLSNKTQLLKQLEDERKLERRKRRQKKRQRAEQRQALERKVPRHIRRAHTKAREITERFLGLLRAECEKVMLFAQSRLGELADTAGSLRFPAMEDHHHHSHNHPASSSSRHHHHHGSGMYETAPLSPTGSGSRGTVGSYDYPLSDGGMHPSASSSSVRILLGDGVYTCDQLEYGPWINSLTNTAILYASFFFCKRTTGRGTVVIFPGLTRPVILRTATTAARREVCQQFETCKKVGSLIIITAKQGRKLKVIVSIVVCHRQLAKSTMDLILPNAIWTILKRFAATDLSSNEMETSWEKTCYYYRRWTKPMVTQLWGWS